MKIAIASTNPVKINAVKRVFQPIYPQARFISVPVDSSVKPQPTSDKETQLGARNRCLKALTKAQADMAVGLEGGIMQLNGQTYSTAWAAVADKTGRLCFGGGMHFLLPPRVIRALRRGQELGEIIDQLTGQTNQKTRSGAVAVFTRHLTTRTAEYTHLVKLAMVKFRRPDLYRA